MIPILAAADSAMPDLPAILYVPIALALVTALGYVLKWIRDEALKRDEERSAQRKEDLADKALMVAAIEGFRAELRGMRCTLDDVTKELARRRAATRG